MFQLALTDSPLGPVDLTEEQIFAYIDAKIGIANCAYGVTKMRNICHNIVYWTGVIGLRTSWVAAQMLHETNFFRFTGDVTPEQNNFAGIGTTGGGVKGNSFPDEVAGIRAVCFHHATYIWGRFPNWPTALQGYYGYDVRYANVLAAGLGASIRTLDDYGGKWAADVDYDHRVLDRANELLAFIQKGNMADDSRFQWSPELGGEFGYPAGTHGRIMLDSSSPYYKQTFPIELFVIHITIGNDSLSYLDGANQSSVTYLTDKLARPRAQLLSESDAPWAGGHPLYNLRGIHLEVEKLTLTSPWSEEMYRNLAATCYPIAKRLGIPLVYLGKDNGTGKRGFIGHSDIPDPSHLGQWGGSTHHEDPGANFDWPKFISYMQALDTPVQQTPAAPAPQLRDPHMIDSPFSDNGQTVTFWIVDDFYTLWSHLGDECYPIMGRPVSPMHIALVDKTNRKVQHYERGSFGVYEEGTPDGVPAGNVWRVRQLFPQERAAALAEGKLKGIVRADVV